MYLLGKYIDSLEELDIINLIKNGVSESKHLDYKKEIHIDNDKEKKEFLADLTAFSNSEGGIIIYGISEQKDSQNKNTGIPEKIIGLNISNEDILIQKIENLNQTCIQPTLTLKPHFKEIEGLKVLLLGIGKYLDLPNMITFKKSNRFYKRQTSGKYLPDVFEISNLFMRNQEVLEKAIQFRDNRITDIRNKSFLPNLDTHGSFILHVIPISYLNTIALDFTNKKFVDTLKNLSTPIHSSGGEKRHNLEGYLTFESWGASVKSYNQIFRNGSMEFYTNKFHTTDSLGEPAIWALLLEKET